jgi:hypothetical protein
MWQERNIAAALKQPRIEEVETSDEDLFPRTRPSPPAITSERKLLEMVCAC